MPDFCTLKYLNLSFGAKNIFNNSQLTIHLKDRIGLIGLNGYGKTSLFKILEQQLIPDQGHPPFNFIKNKDAHGNSLSVFTVPQVPPMVSNTTVEKYLYHFHPQFLTIQNEIEEINLKLDKQASNTSASNLLIEKQKNLLEQFEHLDGWKILSTYKSYLKYFGLENHSMDISDLSGGELRKVLISIGLTHPANLILWDEPTNHLDLKTIKLLEDELLMSNKTYMIISHDRYFLAKVTNKTVHIHNQSINNFNGNYSDYIEYTEKQNIYVANIITKLKNAHRREQAWMNQGIKARGCRSKKRVENFNQLEEKINNIKLNSKNKLQISISNTQNKNKKLVKFSNINKSYSQNEILSNLNFTIYRGDKIGVLGDNGSGKSTLAKLIAQQIKPSSGEIFHAENLSVQYFSQDRKELNNSKTPYELLGSGKDLIVLPDGRQIHVNSYFTNFLFNKDDIKRPMDYFSGGERNRLQLAKNLTNSSDIWIFDEPTNDLDLETIQILENVLSKFKGTVIIISHDRAFLSAVTNKIWLMENNTIECFSSGYSQAEEYIEIIEYEKIILNKNKKKSSLAVTDNLNIKKIVLTNKEKQRIKTIDQDILNTEENLSLVEKEILEFNYNDMNEHKQIIINDLSSKKDEYEEKLLSLYEEKELLDLKIKDSNQ